MTVRQTGILTDVLDESSGIACSRFVDGVCYTHNDSQGKAQLYAINPEGKLLATINIRNARNRDWEDISISGNMIYIGDVGDNLARKGNKTIYRIKEPKIDPSAFDVVMDVTAEHMTFEMPDGGQNCESILTDSTGDVVYLITKRPERGGTEGAEGKRIMTVPWGGSQATDVGVLGGNIRGKVTGADMSPDDSLIVVRTYTHVYLYMTSGQSPEKVLQSRPCASLRHKEKQGEAIGFSRDGKVMYTTSEGVNEPVYEISIKMA